MATFDSACVWLHECSAMVRCRNTTKKTIHTFIFVFLKSVSLCLAPRMLGNGSVPQHHQKKRFTLSSVEMATFHSACVWLHECSAMARCRNTTKKTIHLFIFVFLKNVVFGSMNARQWLGSETPPNRQFKPSVLSQVFRFVWLHACSATARCRNTTKKTIHTFIFVFLKSVSLCLAP